MKLKVRKRPNNGRWLKLPTNSDTSMSHPSQCQSPPKGPIIGCVWLRSFSPYLCRATNGCILHSWARVMRGKYVIETSTSDTLTMPPTTISVLLDAQFILGFAQTITQRKENPTCRKMVRKFPSRNGERSIRAFCIRIGLSFLVDRSRNQGSDRFSLQSWYTNIEDDLIKLRKMLWTSRHRCPGWPPSFKALQETNALLGNG